MIDLGDVKNITRIEIQGRPHSTEYVTEFSISYGYNGLDYQDFKEPGGNTKVTERANESSGTQINIIIDPKRRRGSQDGCGADARFNPQTIAPY